MSRAPNIRTVPGLILFVFFGLTQSGLSQHSYVLDSLKQRLSRSENVDTSRILALSAIADYYGFIQFDSSLLYASKVAELSQKINYPFGSFLAFKSNFFAYNCQGNYPRALEAALNYLQTANQLEARNPALIVGPHYFIGLLNREMGDFSNAATELHEAIRLQQKIGMPLSEMYYAFSQLGIMYLNQGNFNSALKYAQMGYDLGCQSREYKRFFSLAMAALGDIHIALHNYKQAERFYRMGIEQSGSFNNIYFQARNYNGIAALFLRTDQRDSCIFYAKRSLPLCLSHGFGEYTVDASKILAAVYDSMQKPDSSLKL